jgi:hypothetical protein
MAVAWRINGALAANATTVTLSLVAPTTGVIADDIFLAIILSKSEAVTPPDGTWTAVKESFGSGMQCQIFWHRVVGGDEGATFNFTKDTDDNILFCGFIACFSGCITSTTPIDATAPSESINASSDTVTYADFNPTETAAHVVACGFYANDLTTAGAMSGTDPTFTNRADLETAAGSDASIFMYEGASSGAATGSRTHSTTSTADAANLGILFGLVAQPAGGTNPGWYSSRGMWW